MPLTRPSLNQINTTITALNDPLTVLNKGGTTANQDVGFVFNRDGGSTANVAIIWDETNDQFALGLTTANGAINSNVTISSYANLRVGNITTGSIQTDNFTVDESLTIGSQIFYAQGTNGFSVNEDFDPSNSSTQTAYHYTSGAGRETVAFTLARTGQFTDGFGIYGTSSDNKFVMFGEQNNTSWEWRRGVGIRPLDLDGGTLVANLSAAGNFTVSGNIDGANVNVDDTLRIAQSGSGLRMTNVGAFDNDGSDNFRVFATNNLVLSTNGDSGNVIYLSADGDIALNSDTTITGNVLPSANLTYNLGSITNQWHSLYVGPGSLYVNGQKVLQEDSGTIVFSADENQNISIQTAGSGDIEFNPGGSIELKGNVVLAAGKTLSQAGGAASEFSAGVKADSVTARTTNTSLTLSGNGTGVVNVNDSLTVANDVTVTGNLTVNGATTTVSSTNTTIEDALLLLADGQSGSPTKDAGFVVERGSSTNVAWLWDESADEFVAITTSDDATTAGDVSVTDYADIRVGAATIDDTITLGGTLITATATEINYLDGVTSAIQTQIDNISSSFTLAADSGSNDTFTTGETLTIAGGTGIDTTVSDNQISIAVDSTIATQTYVNTANTNMGGYVDNAVSTANVNLKGYTDGQLASYATTSALTTANTNVVGYVDGEVTTLNSTITTANTNVVGYVDNAVSTANVNLKGYTDATFETQSSATTANTNMKGYVDAVANLSSYSNSNVTAYLTTNSYATETYVDTANTNVVGYVDSAVSTANVNLKGYTDGQLASYATTSALTTANTNVVGYVDGEITTVNSTITTANTNLKGYADATFQTTSSATTANTNVVGYVDNAVSTANVNLKGYVDNELTSYATSSDLTTANTNVVGYVDGEITTVNSTITTANTNLKGYADATFLTSFTETNDLTSAVTWANIPDANVPQSAVTQHQSALTITESQISDLGTYATTSALTTANTNVVGYVDGEITTVNSTITTANTNVVGYVDNAVSTANVNLKGYVDAGNTNVVGYVDNAVTTANTNLKGYTDGQLASYATTSALTTANTNMQGYVDNEISSLIDSAPGTLDTLNEIAAALGDDPNLATTLTNTITTANTNVVGYVDGEITTVNSTITTANTNVVGYVDNAVSTANVNLKGYVDAGNTNVVGYVDNAVTTANTNLKGYTDGQLASYATTSALTTANTNMGGYVDNAVSTANVNLKGYVDAGNTNVVGYVDNAVSTANVNLKGYADATFVQPTLTADIDADDTYTIINLVDPTSAQDAVTLSYLESALSSDVTNIGSDDTSVAVTDNGVNPGYIELTVDNTVRGNVTSSGINVTGLSIAGTAVTATAAELNILDGVTADATELNLLDGVTATTAELNYVDGVTSAIQTQLDAKAPTASPSLTGDVIVTGNVETTGGEVNVKARGEVRFFETDNGQFVALRAPNSVASNVTFNLPGADGTVGQVLQTDGAGTMSWVDQASGGSGGTGGFYTSTINTHPAANGDEDLATGPSDDTLETPFDTGGTDEFGVSMGVVYDQMEPQGQYLTYDLGDGEAYVGA